MRSYSFMLGICVYVCIAFFAIHFVCTRFWGTRWRWCTPTVSCSYSGAKNRILKNPCLSLTSCLLPCLTLFCQWHPFSFATATEDECVRVLRMVAGALCEFIAEESSTYERWLRFESSEKKVSFGQWSIFYPYKFISSQVSFLFKTCCYLSLFQFFIRSLFYGI